MLISSGIVIAVASLGSPPPFPKSISVPPAPVASVISSRRIEEAAKAVYLMYSSDTAFLRVKLAVANTQYGFSESPLFLVYVRGTQFVPSALNDTVNLDISNVLS